MYKGSLEVSGSLLFVLDLYVYSKTVSCGGLIGGGFRGEGFVAPCESRLFSPMIPHSRHSFSDCPRLAETERRTGGKLVKLCSKCAKMWDEHEAKANAGAG